MGDHLLNIMALAEAETEKRRGFFTTVSNFSNDAFGYDNLSAGAVRLWEGTNSFYSDEHMESFMLRAQYDYKDRYNLTINARTDGSSKVGLLPINQWCMGSE